MLRGGQGITEERVMQSYENYQAKLAATEREEEQSSEWIERQLPTWFVWLFSIVSAASTYYLSALGMKASPLYARTIGADNGALLITGLLEGSFLALVLWGHRFLKSRQQREVAAIAITVLKVVLSVNILLAFAMLSGAASTIAPIVELYAPLTIVASGWFWSYIIVHRRATVRRNKMLDTAATVEDLWAQRYEKDQKKYLEAYAQIFDGPQMDVVRNEMAIRSAIGQIASEHQITYAEAHYLYWGEWPEPEPAPEQIEPDEQQQLEPAEESEVVNGASKRWDSH
jgi:hypothetical protein